MLPHFPNRLLIALLAEAVACPGEEWKPRRAVMVVAVMVGGRGRIASLLVGLVGLQQEVGEREAVGSAWVVVESEVRE